MTSAILASLIAALSLGFIEGLGRFYPARSTWWRLRRMRGRRGVRTIRERLEDAAGGHTARRLAVVLIGLVIGWIASASLLDKRWYEVSLDVTPYAIVAAALLRTPHILAGIAERMKVFERQAGEDPDSEPEEEGGEGPQAISL